MNKLLVVISLECYDSARTIGGAKIHQDLLGYPGNGKPMSPADGAFDGIREEVYAVLDDAGRPMTVFVWAYDDAFHWGKAKSWDPK